MASSGYSTGRFFVREEDRIRVTQLLVVLLVVASSHVVFALDSIRARLGILAVLVCLHATSQAVLMRAHHHPFAHAHLQVSGHQP